MKSSKRIMKIAFLLYPIEKVNVKEDSSFWIMHELALRGHQIYHFESTNLFFQDGEVSAFVKQARMHPKKGFDQSPQKNEAMPLSAFHVIFIRKEPPFDNDYLYVLQILNTLKERVFVLNDPAGIAMSNEKLFICQFKNIIPKTLVTDDAKLARSFIATSKVRVVIKPLDNKAGVGIFSVSADDKSLPSFLDIATHGGKRKIMIQHFVQSRGNDDKRILLLNGSILGVFARRPAKGDFRSNLSVGGSMQRASISKQDRHIVNQVSPELLRRGLYFVGIDIIGRFLTEINVTSPSGIPEINSLYGTSLQKDVADFIESRA